MFNKKGFTLIELMVALAIIAILATVGYSLFNGAQRTARNGKRVVDVQSIGKAYELHYTPDGGYQRLTPNQFEDKKIPIPPDGGSYNFVSGPDAATSPNNCSQVKICTTLEPAHGKCSTPSSTCKCYEGVLDMGSCNIAFVAGTPSPSPSSTPGSNLPPLAPFTPIPSVSQTPAPSPFVEPVCTKCLTLISLICPSYADVPANAYPQGSDFTGGHWRELNTSYQTDLTNPDTDIPSTCHREDGGTFTLYQGSPANYLTKPIKTFTTGADGTGSGSTTLPLDQQQQIIAGRDINSPDGLWVSVPTTQGGASLGSFRCFTDIINSDITETIFDYTVDIDHIYCISYFVRS